MKEGAEPIEPALPLFLNSPARRCRLAIACCRSVAMDWQLFGVSRLQSHGRVRLVNAGGVVMDLGHLIGDHVRFGGRID